MPSRPLGPRTIRPRTTPRRTRPTPTGDRDGDETPAPDPDPTPPPAPVAPTCPPGEIPTDDGGCTDPAVLAELLAEYEAAALEEAETLVALGEALATLNDLEAELDDLEDEVAAAQLRLTHAADDAAFAQLRESVAGDNLSDVQDALASEQDRLRRQVVDAYVSGDEAELDRAGAMLDANSPLDMAAVQEYAGVVIDDQLSTLDRIDALAIAVEEMRERVDALGVATQADVVVVQELERELLALVAEQRVLVREAAEQTEALAREITEIQQRKAEFASELEIQAAGGGAIGAMLREIQRGQQPPEAIAGLLISPLDPSIVVSGYGPRLHPIFGVNRMHTGLDMDAPPGAPIVATADGQVLFAREEGGYGNTVVVDHGNGIATLYAHMSAFAVKPGTLVEAGDTIGFVGSTGWSTGPHLHFEVRIFGDPVDPLPYVDLSAHAPPD